MDQAIWNQLKAQLVGLELDILIQIHRKMIKILKSIKLYCNKKLIMPSKLNYGKSIIKVISRLLSFGWAKENKVNERENAKCKCYSE